MSENEGSLVSSPSPTVHLLNLNLTTIEGIFSLKVSKRPIPLKSAGIQDAEQWCRGVSETAGFGFFFAFWNLKKGLYGKANNFKKHPRPSHTARFRPGEEPELRAGAMAHPSCVLICFIFLSLLSWRIIQYY